MGPDHRRDRGPRHSHRLSSGRRTQPDGDPGVERGGSARHPAHDRGDDPAVAARPTRTGRVHRVATQPRSHIHHPVGHCQPSIDLRLVGQRRRCDRRSRRGIRLFSHHEFPLTVIQRHCGVDHHRARGAAAGSPFECRRRPRPLHEIRIHGADARRGEAVYVHLRAERHRAEVSVSHHADAVQRRTVWRGSISIIGRAVGALSEGRLHFRLSGRARPLHVRGGVSAGPSVRARQEKQQGHRRKHRYLRHDRVAAEERGESQRPRRHGWRLAARLSRCRKPHQLSSGAESRITAGAHSRLLHGR